MNMGSCPYEGCNGTIMEPVPDKTPAFSTFNCEECNGKIWYKHSRIESIAWTEKAFLEVHEVDHDTMEIKELSKQMSDKKTFEFTLRCMIPDDGMDPLDRLDLFGEEFDDAIICVGRKGRIIFDFGREADSVQEAIEDAFKDILKVLPDATLLKDNGLINFTEQECISLRADMIKLQAEKEALIKLVKQTIRKIPNTEEQFRFEDALSRITGKREQWP